MKSLKKVIKEVFYDTLYEADVVMRSDTDRNITKITDNLRGLCGITICTVASPAKKVAPNVEKTYLKIKFFKLEPTIKEHLARMAIDARKVDGVFSFIPYKVDKVVNRIYRN